MKNKVLYTGVLAVLFWGHLYLFLWLTWWALFVTDRASGNVFWWWCSAGGSSSGECLCVNSVCL